MKPIGFMGGLLLIALVSAYSRTPGNTPLSLHDRPPTDSGRVERHLPADIAWITLFSDSVRKNGQGHWEARLMHGIEMIYIPAGDFRMGSTGQEPGFERDDGPVHRVGIKGIWIGKYEVTRAVWRAVMGGAPLRPEEMDLPQGDVSYLDIQRFLAVLRGKSGLAVRLPTEAEWEKCCRGGSTSTQYGLLDRIAWTCRNSGGKAHPVGTKEPNGFGIYDMLGNVWEWCNDWYGANYYSKSPPVDPAGPPRGERRVMRGGGFNHCGHYLRMGHRNNYDPAKSNPHSGFRLAMDGTLTTSDAAPFAWETILPPRPSSLPPGSR